MKRNEFQTFTDSNGNHIANGSFLDGFMHGHWRAIYEEGGILAEGNYVRGKTYENSIKFFEKNGRCLPKEGREGKFVSYYNNGYKQSESIYRKGKQTNVVTYYYQSNGKIWRRVTFKKHGNNIRHGLYESWYENGNKRSEIIYENDKPTKIIVEYNKDGSVNRVEELL